MKSRPALWGRPCVGEDLLPVRFPLALLPPLRFASPFRPTGGNIHIHIRRRGGGGGARDVAGYL